MEENKKNGQEDVLKVLVEQNKKILESVERTRKYMNYLRIVNVVKIVLIIVPLIFALIYVPPFLQSVINAYEEILGISPFEVFQDIKNGQ